MEYRDKCIFQSNKTENAPGTNYELTVHSNKVKKKNKNKKIAEIIDNKIGFYGYDDFCLPKTPH